MFGISVALSGNTLVVGSAGDDDAGSGSGSAYVFRQSATSTWVQEAKLTASSASAGDSFGYTVAIHNDLAAIGSRFLNGSGGVDQGAVFLYRRSGMLWLEEAQLTTTDALPNDNLGYSIAIENDKVLTGAWRADGAGGADAGGAYLFERSGNGIWNQRVKYVAADSGAGDRYGTAVGLSGGVAVIGAAEHDGPTGLDFGACYIVTSSTIDCDENGIPDACESGSIIPMDCNDNGIPDECEVNDGFVPDCNENAIPDSCDIASGSSTDVNQNGIPDECDPIPACPGDLNGDGTVNFSDLNILIGFFGQSCD